MFKIVLAIGLIGSVLKKQVTHTINDTKSNIMDSGNRTQVFHYL